MKDKKYTQDKSFARVPNHKDNPDYRMIIIYTFHQHYLSHKSLDETASKLDEMVYSFRARRPFNLEHNSKHYVEMYPEEMKGQTGYIVVDKTDASPALIIYPYSTSSYMDKPNKPRMLALNIAIEDIASGKEKIFGAFLQSESWAELEPKLKEIFRYKDLNDEEKQAA